MSKTKPTGQKVPQVEQVAELAMQLGQRHLADYGATRSRHDFTQRQLLTGLILRAYLKTTYRGVLDVLATSDGLRRRGRKFRRWVKVAVVVVAGAMLPVALAIDLKPTHDCVQARTLLAQTQAVIQPDKLYADAGYDAEWIHTQCREQWGVDSVIPAVPRRADGTAGGKWRAQMTPEYLQQHGYTRRWTVESFFSALKRTMGSTLSARRPDQMVAEAAFKVLAYTLRR